MNDSVMNRYSDGNDIVAQWKPCPDCRDQVVYVYAIEETTWIAECDACAYKAVGRSREECVGNWNYISEHVLREETHEQS